MSASDQILPADQAEQSRAKSALHTVHTIAEQCKTHGVIAGCLLRSKGKAIGFWLEEICEGRSDWLHRARFEVDTLGQNEVIGADCTPELRTRQSLRTPASDGLCLISGRHKW